MSGIVQYYYLGTSGGFNGLDGMASRILEMTVWAGNREWWTCNYLYHGGDSIKPLAKVSRFVPSGPCLDESVRIALVIFAGSLFKECPSYEKAGKELGDVDFLDFDCEKDRIPQSFFDLVEESKEKDYLKGFDLYTAVVNPVYKY